MTTITRLFWSIIWLTVMMVVLGGGRQVSAQGGTLVWEDQVDGSGGDNAFFPETANAIAAEGSRVFAAGNLINLNTGTDFAVRGYDAATGALLWKDDVDGDLAGSEFDEVIAIAANGNRVFAAGILSSISTGGDFAVRGYDAVTGALLWKNTVDGDLVGGYNSATAITALGNRVFAAGNLTNTNTGQDITVRAYDAATGVLLWKDDVDGPQTESADADWGCAVASQGNMVFAAGNIRNADNSAGLLVRAYDAASGQLLWQDKREGTLPCSHFVLSTFIGVNTVAIADNHLVLAGSVENTSGGTDFLVRTYEVNTGALLWEDRVKDAGAGYAVTIQGCRVYVTGSFLRAYEAQSGSLLWTVSDPAVSLSIQGNLVATADFARNPANNNSQDFAVRAYNAETGALLWDDYVDGSSKAGDVAFSVLVHQCRVFAVGALQNSSTSFDFTVRAYDATGPQCLATPPSCPMQSTCAISGQVVRMYDNASSAYAYIKPSALSSIYYYTYSADSTLRDALRSCRTSGKRCTVRASASACPTTGTGHYMGATTAVYQNP